LDQIRKKEPGSHCNRKRQLEGITANRGPRHRCIWNHCKGECGAKLPSYVGNYYRLVQLNVFANGDWSRGTSVELNREDCAKSVDIGEVVCPQIGHDSTCSLYSSVGTRVISCQDVRIDNSVFAVPVDRAFMLPTKGIGYTAHFDHISKPPIAAASLLLVCHGSVCSPRLTGVGTSSEPVELETLSEWPRVFLLRNFVSAPEVAQLVAAAQELWRSGAEGVASPNTSAMLEATT
jgi:hypothetical protein